MAPPAVPSPRIGFFCCRTGGASFSMEISLRASTLVNAPCASSTGCGLMPVCANKSASLRRKIVKCMATRSLSNPPAVVFRQFRPKTDHFYTQHAKRLAKRGVTARQFSGRFRPHSCCVLFAGVLTVGATFAGAGQAQWADARFNREEPAILSDKCFSCHGPDANHRKADLRFDSREGASQILAVTPRWCPVYRIKAN